MGVKKFEHHIFALAPTGDGISGSDRIFIELAREWSKNIPVEIYTTQEGVRMCEGQQLTGDKLTINKVEKANLPESFILKYLYKIYLGCKLGFKLRYTKYVIRNTIIYSSSDFWMDVLPAVILKIRYKNKIRWIATWYQTAPNPIIGFSEPHFAKAARGKETQREKTYNLSALLYWLSQLPVKPLIKLFADKVIVNNEDERKRFKEMYKKGKVIVLLGAVRLDEINKYLKTHNSQLTTKKYDAVFQGRFHPQKGVVELIDIWKKVVDKIPNAKLAMIGDGPLMQDVRNKILDLGLEDNIKLFGYIFDGGKKYKIFSQSKIVVHPAYYDSGGMASAEAMAFGLPCIGFDLKAYESYYPKGMMKVSKGDIGSFSEAIINLLKNQKLRTKLGKEALQTIKKNWSWKNRAKQLYQKII